MNEAGISGEKVANPEEARKQAMSQYSKTIRENEAKKPSFNNSKIADLRKELTEVMEKAFSKHLSIDDTIENLTADAGNFPKSNILKGKDFQLIKSWLPKEFAKNKFELLYQGSKDGFTIQTFHSKCDKKGPTVTVIHTKTGDKVFGGFMDQSWASEDTNINSEKAFLFSITNKTKHNPKNSGSQFVSFSAYDTGPNFGDGDLSLYGDFSNEQQSCYPYTFDYDANTLVGANTFTVKEIEIYCLK